MHYVLVEEIWSVPKTNAEASLIRLIGPVFGGDRQSANESGKKLVGKFDHRGYQEDASDPYWWGRNDGASESHRFIIRPAN